MSNTLVLTEPTVNYLMATWTGLRLERGASSTNLGSFTLVTQIPYVTGQTTYTYADVAGAASDWYRVARYGPSGIGTYSPPWPVTPTAITAGNGSRRSLKNCRRLLARRLQSLQVVTTTADGNAGGTTILSSALATITDSNRYSAWWAMPTDGVSAGLIRTIDKNALNPSSGEMVISPAFLSQIVRGTEIEFHKLLPPEELGGLLGLRQALNMALEECWVLDRVAFVALANSVSWDVSTLGDWLDPEAIAEFYGPSMGATIPLYPWSGYNARRDGESVLLDVAPGFAAGASTSVEVTRPGDTYVRVGGVWTDNQQGFQNDDDECLFQPSFLVEVALAYCYEALAASTTGAAMLRFNAKADQQRTRANIMKYRGLPNPPERPNHAGAAYGGNHDWLRSIR